MMRLMFVLSAVLSTLFIATAAPAQPVQISGRYPHLAMINDRVQGECGIGAVVPWAGRLWVVTYGPHAPDGSPDKLYEITEDLTRITRPESVGGTPANRMIHRESNQLLIGPYLIDADRNVRVIPPSKMFGRLTATARHLTDPANKVYYYDMEGLIYEADVNTLDVKLLYKRAMPGWHGKGAYTGQGRFIVANNGERESNMDRFKPFEYQVKFDNGGENAGALGEWDDKQWRLIERRQFTEVTGPGGIHGSPSDTAPVWSMGWDKRSLLLMVLDGGEWHKFRLPKTGYSFDGTHGWHTEWPRIREVVPASGDTPAKLLANMHGGWFDFPQTFSAGNPSGLRPIGAFAKMTGDFAPWKGGIVFGCDDAAKSGFMDNAFDTLNTLNGQSNSNLWFTTWADLAKNGRPAGYGGPWVEDDVKADALSEPYLFAGYAQRTLHLTHGGDAPVAFTLQIDGKAYKTLTVPARGYAYHVFPADVPGEWVRLKTDRDASKVSAYFHYGPGGGAVEDRALFAGLADVGESGAWTRAVMRTAGTDELPLMIEATTVDASGTAGAPRYYQMDSAMRFTSLEPDHDAAKITREKAALKPVSYTVDEAGVLLVEGKDRYRVPVSSAGYEPGRSARELATERSIVNAGGTFYILPRINSGGMRRMKPLATHDKRISDFCSWRGLMVLAGTRADAKPGPNVFAADDDTALWFGDIDDLWKFGKARGVGGPWAKTAVKPGEPSDPYLMTGYDRKTLSLSHDGNKPVTFTVQVDFLATGAFAEYARFTVKPGETLEHKFPEGFAAHWVRLAADRACAATARFVYE